MDIEKILKLVSGTLCSLFGFLFGAANGLFYALIAFIVLDYISGVMAAWVKKELSSEVGAKGIVKKVFILVIVAVGNLLDVYVIGDGNICRSAVIGFYIANEAISILENAANIGLPLPQKLIDVLQQLKSKGDDENGD